MKVIPLAKIYIASLLLAIAFPFVLFIHNNNIGSREIAIHNSNDIKYSIDNCSYKDNIIKVSGWAFLMNRTTGATIKVYVYNKNSLLQIKTKTNKSPDVSVAFGGDKTLNNTRFYASKKISLKDDKVDLVISIEDKNGVLHDASYKC